MRSAVVGREEPQSDGPFQRPCDLHHPPQHHHSRHHHTVPHPYGGAVASTGPLLRHSNNNSNAYSALPPHVYSARGEQQQERDGYGLNRSSRDRHLCPIHTNHHHQLYGQQQSRETRQSYAVHEQSQQHSSHHATRHVYSTAIPPPSPAPQRQNVYTLNKENIDPALQLPSSERPVSDRQLLRQRFAAWGVSLDHSRRVGTGRYSKVLTAHLRDGTKIAIKTINISKVTPEFRTKFLPREIECWEKLRHGNLVRLLNRDEVFGRVFLFMEFGPCGDLLQHVQKNGPVKEACGAQWMRQIIGGLSYMHKMNIVHRDLKLENIIIFEPNLVKISDFGFSRRVGHDLSHTYCGSKSYSPPEILAGQPYSPFKADVWSVGIIAYVMLTDRMPFKDSAPNQQIIDAQKNRKYVYPENLALSDQCMMTIDTLLVFNWQQRPSVADAARMPWFRSPLPPTNDQQPV